MNFPITTEVERAQAYFNQALTFTYGFNHAEAARSYREAARLDPDCGICWWGVALSYGPNINKAMEESDVAPAWEATKEDTGKVWDATKEVSGDAWEATKEGGSKAWDKTKEVSGETWDKVTGDDGAGAPEATGSSEAVEADDAVNPEELAQ